MTGAHLVRGILSVPADAVSDDDLDSLVVLLDGNERFEMYDYDSESKRFLLPRTLAKKYGVDLLANTVVEPRQSINSLTPIKLGGKPEWEGQPEAVEKTTAHLLQEGGAILCAECGTGKTVMALEIARRLGQATLILVHKEFLVNQWKGAIEQFFPSATVGRWQQDKFDSGKDFDFVIGMIQSVTSKRKYPNELYDSFGTVITDEVHRLGAQCWGEVIEKFPGRYRLGVTATPDRRDGMQVFFLRHIGAIVHHMRSEREKPAVAVVATGIRLEKREYMNVWNWSINFAKLANVLAANAARNAIIVAELIRAADAGRTIMVLSDRLGQLDVLMKAVSASRPNVTQGKYVGGMKQKALDESEDCQIIYGTNAMASEALNIPRLDTLFLVTPKTRIEQAVGRIQRTFKGKKAPLVVDFLDKTPICETMYISRLRRYGEMGIDISAVKVFTPAPTN